MKWLLSESQDVTRACRVLLVTAGLLPYRMEEVFARSSSDMKGKFTVRGIFRVSCLKITVFLQLLCIHSFIFSVYCIVSGNLSLAPTDGFIGINLIFRLYKYTKLNKIYKCIHLQFVSCYITVHVSFFVVVTTSVTFFLIVFLSMFMMFYTFEIELINYLRK